MSKDQIYLEFPSWRDALSAQLPPLLSKRPKPLRKYDQIHMLANDLITHTGSIYKNMVGKDVLFLGDTDGVILALLLIEKRLAKRIGSPKSILLLDFDKRLIKYYNKVVSDLGSKVHLELRTYNVFKKLPTDLISKYSYFHTNPPFGRYNEGRSIVAFVDRCLAAVKDGSTGTVILGHDDNHPWTQLTLRHFLKYALKRGLVPQVIMPKTHRYHLDDSPDLRSGYVQLYGPNATPPLLDPNKDLPEEYKVSFYGRETIPIPDFIPESEELDDKYSQEMFF